MIVYIKLGRVRGLSIEWNKEFGFQPVYKKTSYRCETIVDMPYSQAIYTSGQWTPQRRAANDQQKDDKITEPFVSSDRN